MINIVINNRQYSVPSTWHEITLDTAIELQRCVRNASAREREYFVSQFEPSAHEPKSESAEIIDFLIDTAAMICAIPKQELRLTDPVQVESFVCQYLSQFIVSMIFEPVFTPCGIDRFEWQGELYMLPKSGRDVAQALIPLDQITAEQLCLATDLHVEGSLEYAALIVAILCHRQGEKFSLAEARNRATTMARLPMSIVLEVFFCFRRLISI